MIAVDSILIPKRFVALCSSWYSSGADLLYAVSSTGGLTMGNRRPRGCDSAEKWYYTLWCDLSVDVGRAVQAAKDGCNASAGWDVGDGEGHDADYSALVEFEAWVDSIVDALAASYGLEDWDGEAD